MQQQDVGHVAMSWQIKEAIDAGPIGSQIYKLFCYRSVFISFNRQFEKFAFQTINENKQYNVFISLQGVYSICQGVCNALL